MRPFGQRQQTDRVAPAVRADVSRHFSQEVDERLLAERTHLVGQLGGHRPPVALGAGIATAGPARRVVDADVSRYRPVGLVPEHVVGAALERGVRPLPAERAVVRLVQATRRDAPPVVEHLARLGMERHPAALGLAAERAPEAPWTHLDSEPEVMRRGHDVPHRSAVVGEIVFGERVQHPGVAARREVGHVA